MRYQRYRYSDFVKQTNKQTIVVNNLYLFYFQDVLKVVLRSLSCLILDYSKATFVVNGLGCSLYHGLFPSLLRATIETCLSNSDTSKEMPSVSLLYSVLELMHALISTQIGSQAIMTSGTLPALLPLILSKNAQHLKVFFFFFFNELIEGFCASHLQFSS